MEQEFEAQTVWLRVHALNNYTVPPILIIISSSFQTQLTGYLYKLALTPPADNAHHPFSVAPQNF